MEPGTPVTIRGKTWGRVADGTVIVQLPSESLIAVPLEDLEAGQA